MKNQIVEKQQNQEVVPQLSNSLGCFGNKSSFEMMVRASNVLSQSTLVPKQYQGNQANCIIALNMADRMNADPMMVMQNLYIVNGNPGWSSQFLISTLNTSGRFTPLRFEYVGEKDTDSFGCYAYAKDLASGEELKGSTVTIAIAKAEGWYGKTGSKWKTMPEQMLMYRSAAFFIRVYAPEIAMGMRTEDEERDIIDVTPEREGRILDEIKEKANQELIDIPDNVTEDGEIIEVETVDQSEFITDEEISSTPVTEEDPF